MTVCNGCIITCEHGGNRVPARYTDLFSAHGKEIESPRGYDPGALELARAIATALGAPFLYSTMTRLLVELNRSNKSNTLFSPITRSLDRAEKDWLFQNYYMPYLNRVEQGIASLCGEGRRVMHISVHSFPCVRRDPSHPVDVGLLYDLRRPAEKNFCRTWGSVLRDEWPQYRVRMNYPYAGKADRLTAQLRKRFPVKSYAGVELQVSQRRYHGARREWNAFKSDVVEALVRTVQGGAH